MSDAPIEIESTLNVLQNRLRMVKSRINLSLKVLQSYCTIRACSYFSIILKRAVPPSVTDLEEDSPQG